MPRLACSCVKVHRTECLSGCLSFLHQDGGNRTRMTRMPGLLCTKSRNPCDLLPHHRVHFFQCNPGLDDACTLVAPLAARDWSVATEAEQVAAAAVGPAAAGGRKISWCHAYWPAVEGRKTAAVPSCLWCARVAVRFGVRNSADAAVWEPLLVPFHQGRLSRNIKKGAMVTRSW